MPGPEAGEETEETAVGVLGEEAPRTEALSTEAQDYICFFLHKTAKAFF